MTDKLQKKRKRRSSHHGEKRAHTNIKLIGQLTARSHVLNTNPVCIVLEVCLEDSVEYILCDRAKFSLVQCTLRIGRCYKFSNLSASNIKIKSNLIKCFRTLENTMWHEVEVEGEIYHPPSLEEFTNLKGTVSRIDDMLGMIYLNESVPLILNTCSRVARVPMPKEGQEVIIFNVHRIDQENGKTIYAMCVKSFLSIVKEDNETTHSPLNLSPLLVSLGGAFRDYRFILWLQDCLHKLLRSFNDDFLSTYGIPLGRTADFCSVLLQNIAKFVLRRSTVHEKSYLEEFMTAEHNLHCGTQVEEMVPFSLLNLCDIDKENPSLDVDPGLDGSDKLWHYDVKKDPKRFLIGVIAMKNTSHRLTFSDSFGSVSLLLMPQSGQVLKGPDLANLNKKIVLIWDYDVIREGFTWVEEDQVCSQKYRSLAVHLDKVIIISSLSKDWKKKNVDEMMTTVAQNSMKISNSAISNKDQAVNTVSIKSNKDTVANESFCISPVREQPLKRYLSQYIVVQHKSSLCVPKQGRSARCYLLARLLGKMVLRPHAQLSRETNTGASVFISLENSLLGAHPFISVNNVYEIRFPPEFDVNFFRKGSSLSYVEGLQSLLPTVCCVTLPKSCEIHHVDDSRVPTDSLKFGDCYRIDQTLKEANAQELINVTGYVVGRYHQNPRFEREKLHVKANGFGVPGKKIVAIILRDTPPESQLGFPITLYLSYWATLQYPMGLLPGAKVIFRFVVKVNPKSGSKYLRSSVLTSVEVLDLGSNQQCNNNQTKGLWGPRSLLSLDLDGGTKRCLWISLSMAQVHRITITATCSSCSHQCQNGSCTYVGCSATSGSKVFSQASFMTYDIRFSPVMVFVSDSQVRKLFQTSERTWKMIVTLAQIFGQLSYHRSDQSDFSKWPLEQRVFRSFCKKVLLGQRFHMLCRQFNSKHDSGHSYDLPALYVADIAPVSLPMAAS